MADHIRGITVEIAGETQKLTTALNQINGQSRNLQNELKQVERLLKFDPENTELLAQRQQILSEAIRETETRVDNLRQVGAQMQAQLERGEITTQQFREMQREIARAEQDLTRLRQSADSLNEVEQAADAAQEDIKELGDAAQDTGDDMEGLSQHLTDLVKKAAAITTVTAVVKKIGQVTDDNTKAMNLFRAATGATAEETEAMGQSMNRLYNNNLGESFEDIAQTMALVNQRTGQTGEELEKTAQAALLLRDTFDIDVNEGIRGADALMRQFGLTAEEAYTYIANGAQQGLNQNQDLADQIAEYSVHYAALGLSVDDMFNMLSAGAESGVFQIDQLNDAIKEFGILAKDNSDSTKQAFQDLGLKDLTEEFAAGGERARDAFRTVVYELEGMPDKVKQNEIGVALFGTKWEDLGVKAMEALTTANTEVSFTKNSLESINEIRYDSFGDAMAGIGRQLETNIILPVGQKAVPVLTTFSQGLQLAIDHAGEIAPVLAGAAVTVGTFTAATNASAIAQKAQTMATTGVTVATKALNLAMNANPIVLVTTAALGLAAAFVTLYKTNEEFRNKVNETWNSLKNSAGTVWTGIQTTFKNGMNEAKNAVVNGFVSLPAQLRQAGQDAVAGLLSGLTSGAETVVQNITGLGDRAVNAFKEKLGIHSPSKVFQAIGNNIVEGLCIGVDEESGLAIQEVMNLGTAVLNTGDVISEGLITRNEKTGQIIYDSMYTGIMNRLSLYYKDRDARIKAMEDGTEENIAQINKEIEATRTATDIKIKLYQQEYAAKVALIDDETNRATKAIQDQIDAINAQQEAENRAEEEEAYLQKMAELQEKYDTSETEEEKAQLEAQINEQIKAREKKLLQQQRQDEIAALRQQMEEARELAEERKAALQEEMEAKQYQLEQQREQEIQYLNRVVELMQAQVDKKKELEELQTQIKEKEEQLQSDTVSKESKKQIQVDLDGLRTREKNLGKTIENNKLQLQGFLPTLQVISNQYGNTFLEGFLSTENEIMSYINRLAAQMRSAIEDARAAANADVDGSHAKGLSYVPYNGYLAELHEGEAVLTKAENRAYRENRQERDENITVTQNFYDKQDNPVKQQRQAMRELRRLKRVMA